jgi:uncharacterized protein YfaT (DUF1175 family)
MIVLDWLLDSDPAIRWQVARSCPGAVRLLAAERAQVATEGWGAVPGCWRCTLRVLRNGLDHRHSKYLR